MKEKEIGLPSLILMVFSFIASITFTATFGTVVMASDPDGGKGVGIHIIWIFAVVGIIAFFCVWPYARLTRIHPKSNGGLLQYTRATFGKFWGVIAGLLNVSSMGIGAVILMVSMIRQNFGIGAPAGFELIGPNGSWGSWGVLYLDLIGFSLFLLAGVIIYFGVRKLKLASTIVGIITWTVTGLLMIVMIVAWAQNGSGNFQDYADSAKIDLSFKSFSNTFMAIFFAFVGAETFISAGANVKNLKKNASKTLIAIMTMTTVFYIIFTVLIMAAVTGGFGDNPNLQIFEAFGGKTQFAKWAGFALILVTILIRFNSCLQVPLYTASMLEPLATQMYISPKFGLVNKKALPSRAIVLSTVFISLTAGLFLFIPDIIEGITQAPSPFDYSAISAAESIIVILGYGFGISVTMVDAYHQRLKLKVWEWVGFSFVILFLLWQAIMWLISLVENPLNAQGNDQVQAIVATVIQILYVVFTIMLAFLLMARHQVLVKKYPVGTKEHQDMVEYEKTFAFQADNLIDEVPIRAWE